MISDQIAAFCISMLVSYPKVSKGLSVWLNQSWGRKLPWSVNQGFQMPEADKELFYGPTEDI